MNDIESKSFDGKKNIKLSVKNKKILHLLSIRRKLKAKKPTFIQLESWRYKKVKSKWRRPRGIDNHMRTKEGGWPKSVDVGYRSPKKVRGLHPLGFEEVIIHNVKDLDKVNSNQVLRIAHVVGAKKRNMIIEKANELNLYILNKKVKSFES